MNGEATFCYQGPELPGADAISAFADTNNDTAQDPGEPSAAATKVWTLPTTTPLCQVKTGTGGTITANGKSRIETSCNAPTLMPPVAFPAHTWASHTPNN